MIDLESIKDPKFIKDLSIKELYELCYQIREFLIQNISVPIQRKITTDGLS